VKSGRIAVPVLQRIILDPGTDIDIQMGAGKFAGVKLISWVASRQSWKRIMPAR
jgi:hypothetical protein